METSRWMREALRLARRGGGTTSPNPMVGAVVVRGDRIVGRGYHRKAGGPHAEVFALREAGALARGAALFVTLEPCCHVGRTGPCTDQVLEAGIARVVAAIPDPFEKIAGRGLRILRQAGVAVEVGDGAREAARLNEAYLLRVREGRPWVDLKLAVTLDGKIADSRGRSRWITGEVARKRGHLLRWEADAILVGGRTVREDDPMLTARLGKRVRRPLRVVLDPRLRTPLGARVFGDDASRVRIAAAGDAAPAKRKRLERLGAVVWSLPGGRGGGLTLRPLLRKLAAEGVNRLLVEGGGLTAGSFLRERLADRVHLFVAPRAIGEGADAFAGLGALPLARAAELRIEEVSRVGEDLEIVLTRRS
jgi:diaminohydroxyphosphoribosylaminopyrimidine deaminase/5-amino-6-(5-phosphoribosylamino)uracil reductase